MTDGKTNESPVPAPRVLVIDDEQGLCDMLRYGLPKRGFQVECAGRGEEGLAKIRQSRYELVVCDIMMPGMNGLEVLGHIKELSPETQVIMATGFATLESAVESMKKGAFDYVTKPYGLPQLCAILEKALEWQKLRARVDHLEELHRLKDEFMATVSHELRTPITVILGYAGLLRGPVYNAKEQQKGLEAIESKAKGLLQIINNIIDLANVSAKREPIVLEVFSLSEVAKEVVEALRPVAEAKKLALSLNVSSELFMETDRTKMKQILLHLIDNAIKFTPAGQVSIRLDAAKEQHVTIRVQDTGIGIEPQHIRLIFQEFRQIDQSNTRQYPGTGLGLAVCSRFVELLGGKITVDSTPGQGSIFSVDLPGLRPASGSSAGLAVAPLPHSLESAKPKLLLVVDDDPAFARLFQNLLAREGYSVSMAGGGQEALDKMGRQKPDAILLDLMMPGLTGFDVLEAMQKDPFLQGIQVVVMTAKDLTPDERAKIQPRADLIIQKGSKDLPEILSLLNSQLRRSPRT